MTQERFSRIVDDPELLRTITYEELKTLALAYPYAHNLWYFLAVKARQIDHPDVVKNIAAAAAYSLDRTQLFRLVAPQMIAPQEVWMEEAVLELKPIETLKRKLEEELTAVKRESRPEETPAEAVLAIRPEPEPQPEPAHVPAEPAPQAPPESVLPEPESEPEPAPIISPAPLYLSYAAWYGSFNLPVLGEPAAVTQAIQDQPVAAADPEPETPVVAEIEAPEPDSEQEEAPEPVKSGGIAQILAEKSVSENKDVISETLAKLFAKQGYREKAISMYERLILAFPEKSAYFAAEIDKLKK